MENKKNSKEYQEILDGALKIIKQHRKDKEDYLKTNKSLICEICKSCEDVKSCEIFCAHLKIWILHWLCMTHYLATIKRFGIGKTDWNRIRFTNQK